MRPECGYGCRVTDRVPDARAALDAVGVLGDESRWRLFSFIRRARRAVTREEAAESVGISRKLAAFHLDKMVAAGVLRARSASADGVPRVGRRPKVYETVEDDIALSIPGREYRLLADLLLEAVLSESAGETGHEAAMRTARERGRALAATRPPDGDAAAVSPRSPLSACGAMLEQHGYEPVVDRAGSVRLRNCPFHPLAAKAPDLVCGMNHAFLAGYLEGLRQHDVEAVLDPAAGECCVRLDPR
jgi:predicted ArsR family transcriptional regulator